IVSASIACARTCNLDKDIKDLPSDDTDTKLMTIEERDNIIGKIYRRLMEIESRLLPCGLHTVGVPPTASEAVATLVNIASLDRPEDGIKSLPRIAAESMGREIGEIYTNADNGDLEDVQLLQQVTEACRAAVLACVERSTNSEGRIVEVNPFADFFSKAVSGGSSPMKAALEQFGFKGCKDADLEPVFTYLEFCLKQVVADNELGGLLGALNGEYITPGPGGDPIRNPDVLPTGKNMHALDPQSIPTKAAVDCAMVVVDRLLERLSTEQGGEYPETVAFTLWGTDNIKTYGESLAQVLCLAGVRPIADSIGRVNKLELIPLEELGRPRVDVVVSCSGVFRDLFINQMNLLDRGIKMAAEADEPADKNFVRKHALEQAEEFGLSVRDAATRVFSNAAGSYSANKKPSSFMADTTTANAQVRTLSETVRLDARTKLLNPKFYEGMLASGYEGTREITKRLRNTMGWAATAGEVDNFIFEDANDVFIKDEDMRDRLMNLNPNAFRDTVTTFLEANGRGYWETSEENIELLQDLYQEVEDKIEGV
ncbi:unnamed protein product, partial [Ectocarpus sp. 8 AP-2014]